MTIPRDPTSSSRSDMFLALVEQARRGHLKLYIGFAAGVGKTYRMLEEAHALLRRDIDVVLGYIEPHERAETAALLEGLPAVPRRRIDYRGVTVEEMDLDAVLARRPRVVLVDEIAHTNAPGSRNGKRYQDVLELLDAGINVIGAFNIQHLESLSPVVSRIAGVTVRETVPDSFIKRADQVVNLDLTVEDLLDRLRAGKIYPAEKVPHALEHFFRDENLSTLRELSLREVADVVERSSASASATRDGDPARERASSGAGRVLVGMSSYPGKAVTLLRRGSRMASRLHATWFVVYVETPREAVHLIDAEAQRRLHAHLEQARELGAEVVHLQSADPAAALLDFARSHGVSHIIIGRSHEPWWRQLLGRSVPLRLVREAAGFDIHIVSFDEDALP